MRSHIAVPLQTRSSPQSVLHLSKKSKLIQSRRLEGGSVHLNIDPFSLGSYLYKYMAIALVFLFLQKIAGEHQYSGEVSANHVKDLYTFWPIIVHFNFNIV